MKRDGSDTRWVENLLRRIRARIERAREDSHTRQLRPSQWASLLDDLDELAAKAIDELQAQPPRGGLVRRSWE